MLCNHLACTDNAVKGSRLRRGGVYCLAVFIACFLAACAKKEEAAASASPEPESAAPAAEAAAPAASPPTVDHGSIAGRDHEKMARGSGEEAASPAPPEHESARASAKAMVPRPPVDYGSIAGKKYAYARRAPASVSASMTEARADTLPAFPWPPPKPSARLDIPLVALNKAANGKQLANARPPELRVLGDINAALIKVLKVAGYRERSYFPVPSGFVLVTKLEAINADGSAKPDVESLPVGHHFALSSMLDKLVHVQKGWYRVVAFVVTSTPTGASTQPPTEDEATNWLDTGDNALPDAISRAQISGHTCTAYIYEFEKPDISPDAHLMYPSSPDSTSHLAKMGFAEVLQ